MCCRLLVLLASLCAHAAPTHKCVSPAAPSGPPAQQGPLQVNVPCYLLRGQGKDEHYEYEVKLAALDIPPKKLFGNRDERMINERRGHLE